MSEPMTDERRKEFDRFVKLKLPCSYAEILECLEEIDRLKKQWKDYCKTEPIYQLIEVQKENRKLREEVSRLEYTVKVHGDKTCSKVEEENRKAQHYLRQAIDMDTARTWSPEMLLAWISEIRAFLDEEES